MTRWIQTLGVSVLLILLAAIVYRGASEHRRHAAEEGLIWSNPAVAEWDAGAVAQGRWQAGEYRPQVRPVATLVRAVEHLWFDFNRNGYQTAQILLHGAVAVLTFLLLVRWLGSLLLGAIAGGIVAVHPAASHSILYLGGMSEILCTALMLLVLLRCARAGTGGGTAQAVGVGVLGLLAMLTKEVGLLLPLIAAGFLADRPDRKGTGAQRFVAALFLAAVAAILYRFVATAALPEEIRRIPAVDPASGLALFPLLFQALAGIVVEVSVLLVPARLTTDYSWLLLLGGLPLFLLSGAAVLFVIGAVALAARRGGGVERSVLLLLAVLPLAGAAAVVSLQGTLASERTIYAALPGWAGLAALLIRWAGRKRESVRPILAGVAVGIILLLAVRAAARVPDFATQARIAEKNLAAYPKNPQAIYDMGNLRLAVHDYAGAAELYERAIALRPDFPIAMVNLGAAYMAQKEWGLALRALDPAGARSKHVRALRYVDARAHYHAGIVLLQQRRDRDAALAFERTLLFYPDHLGAIANLGSLYIGAPEYVERGIRLLTIAVDREVDEERRTRLQKNLQKAQSMLDTFVDDMGGLPSELGREGRGPLGKPWEEVEKEGM